MCIRRRKKERDRIERRKPSGFTLVEILAALSIFAVIAGALIAVFSKGVDIWNDARMKSSHREEALIFLEKLEKQLKNHIDPVDSKFTADRSSVYFTTLEGSIYNVGYAFNKELKHLYGNKSLYPASLEKVKPVLVLNNVESFDIDCDYPKAEQEEEKKDEDAGFPQTVKIKLIISGAESRERQERYEFSRSIEIPVVR